MNALACITSGIAVSALLFSASATNITIPDGNITRDGNRFWTPTWMGTQSEDNEVEPSCQTGQNWDMEAFLLNGTELTVVSGFNLKDGVWEDNIHITTGDLFVDIGGLNGSAYDYAYDINWVNGTYALYEINASGTIGNITMVPENNLNATSNPVTYKPGKLQTSLANGSLNYKANILSGDALVTATGDQDAASLKGAKNWGTYSESGPNGVFNNKHNIATFDVSRFAGKEAVFHLTMSCGNDDLRGKASIPVPEPGVASLLILGFLSLGGCLVSRKNK